MKLFLSTYINKVDTKGRVSVPSTYRMTLKTDDSVGAVIIYRSFINNCIEACSIERIKQLNIAIESMDVFSVTRDAFAMSLLGESMQLQFDGEGRVKLPATIMNEVGIETEAAFVGKGQVFEIWEPRELEKYKVKARAISIKHRDKMNLNIKQP